jgi:hypothetical protein
MGDLAERILGKPSFLIVVVYLRFEYGTSPIKDPWVTVAACCLVICEGIFL